MENNSFDLSQANLAHVMYAIAGHANHGASFSQIKLSRIEIPCVLKLLILVFLGPNICIS